MQQADFVALVQAAQSLESMSLTTRMSQLVGMPIEKAMAALPGHWSTIATRITKAALKKALDGAFISLKSTPREPSNKTHKILASLSGAVGGSFGITALAIELPVSATIMLRSIADIARSEGEDIKDVDTKMACLTVFALSGGGAGSGICGYQLLRCAFFFNQSVKRYRQSYCHAWCYKRGRTRVIVKLLSAVSTRFSIPVSEKLAVQAIPAIGLIGGASVNLLFINHYQRMAKAHFTVRRLERRYGEELIKQVYTEIVTSNTDNKKNFFEY